MLGTVLYLITFSALLFFLFNYKKTENSINGVSYFIFSFLLVWCYEAVAAGLLNLIHIPINLISVSICDIVAAAVLAIIHIKSGKEKQEYYWDYKDFIAIAVVLIVALVIAYSRYGGWFEVFRFKSGDGANHLVMAESVVRAEKIDAMYFQKFRDAIALNFFAPFLGIVNYYKIFLASQTFLFALGGITFWALIEEELKTWSHKVIGLVLTIIYMLGYPLNNMLYGFTYWGTSILLITFLLYIFREYKKNNISFGKLMLIAFWVNTSLCVCYVYFAPVVFGAQFIYIWYEKKIFVKEKLWYTAFPLFISGVFCIIYVCFGLFTPVASSKKEVNDNQKAGYENVIEAEDVEVDNQESKNLAESESGESEKTENTRGVTFRLSMYGLSYYDLYSNFVLLVPFVFVYLWDVFRKRKFDEYILAILLTVGYIGVQFILYLMGYISLYYYNKNYNLLWLLCFAIMIRVISNTEKSQNQFLIAYGLTCAMLLAGTLIHVDEKLKERDKDLCLGDRAGAYFNLISTNLDVVTDRYNEIKMSPGEQELCNIAAELTQSGYSVAWVAEWPRFDDFYAITNQKTNWKYDLEEEYSKVENKTVDYALVSRNKNGVYCDAEYVDNQKRIFENWYGYIIEVN